VTRRALRRHVPPRAVRGAVLGGLAATLLLASPAAADPFFEPDEAPVDSLALLELDLNHGCFAGGGAEDGGHGHGDESVEQPTVEVAVEVPGEVDHVEPMELDGWELDLETDEDGRVEVITWLAEEGTSETAPVFELEAVHRGEVGDEVFWPVFQGCEEGSYRWVATADEPEGDPAPAVTLTEADPDAPPPEPDEAEAPGDGAAGDGDEADDADPTGEEADPLDAEEAGDEGLPGWLVLVVLLVVVAAIGIVLTLRSRRRAA
jgi:uncharacterized protein YcnI